MTTSIDIVFMFVYVLYVCHCILFFLRLEHSAEWICAHYKSLLLLLLLKLNSEYARKFSCFHKKLCAENSQSTCVKSDFRESPPKMYIHRGNYRIADLSVFE